MHYLENAVASANRKNANHELIMELKALSAKVDEAEKIFGPMPEARKLIRATLENPDKIAAMTLEEVLAYR